MAKFWQLFIHLCMLGCKKILLTVQKMFYLYSSNLGNLSYVYVYSAAKTIFPGIVIFKFLLYLF